MTLNKADKWACKQWMLGEKRHKEAVKQRDDKEEQEQARKCVETKMKKLQVVEYAQNLMRQLNPSKALEILDKSGEGSGVKNLNEYLINEAKLIIGDDSDSEEESGDEE